MADGVERYAHLDRLTIACASRPGSAARFQSFGATSMDSEGSGDRLAGVGKLAGKQEFPLKEREGIRHVQVDRGKNSP